jgi:UDP-glucose 4-epimerase
LKNILVTGACGMIGDVVCETLLKKGNIVVGLDDHLSEHNTKHSDFSYISTQEGIESALEQAFNKYRFDTVLHLACTADNDFKETITEEEIKRSSEYDCIYHMANDNGVTQCILVSTSQVYSKVKTREPLREWDSITKPTTNYGKLKLTSERALATESKLNPDMVSAILRVPPVYSFEFYENLTAKIVDPRDGFNFIYRKGEYGFQFCCVYNLADFIACFIKQAVDKSFTNVYNICDNDLITASDIIQFMKDNYRIGMVLQRPEPKENNPLKLITSKIINSEEKTNYRYLDFNTILYCTKLDNKNASEICPARWNLQNVKPR